MNIDLVFREPLPLLRRLPLREKLAGVSWDKAAFILVWEAQSQASTVAYLALVAFAPIWVALGVMLTWSLLATVVFCAARERGYPNLLTVKMLPEPGVSANAALHVLGTLGRAWVAGFHAFIYARASSAFLPKKQGCCRARRCARFGVLAVGLVLFGVSTAEHMLRSAGYQGRKLVQLSLIGPFLNVPYRILLSAAVVALVTDALDFVAL